MALHFTDPDSDDGAARCTSFGADVVALGAGQRDDWALLRVHGLPEWQTMELRLLDMPFKEDEEWSTYGFPADGGEDQVRGTDYKGIVRVSGALPTIFDEHAAGNAIAGVSGGPAVIEEFVRGVIIRADQGAGGRASTGRLYVLPLSRCGGLDTLVKTILLREPPFLDATAAAVAKGTALHNVVRMLRSEVTEGIQQPQVHIALWVLDSQLQGVMRVVAEARLPQPDARVVIEYAACQWYPADCALAVALRFVAVANDEAKLVSAACSDRECATRLVRRGGFEFERSDTWDDGRVDVAWQPYEGGDALVERMGIALAKGLSIPFTTCSEVNAQLAAFMRGDRRYRQPACYWTVLGEGTSDEAIDKLRAQFPDLGIVILGGVHSAALHVEIDRVKASDQAKELTRLNNRLTNHFLASGITI
jgi:hypothetical protein